MQKMGEEQSMSSNTVSGSECLDWILHDRDKATKPTFNTSHSSYTTNFFNQNPGQSVLEVWAQQSLSSLKEMTNSYFKASETELLAKMSSEQKAQKELRVKYEDGPSKIDLTKMSKSPWLYGGPTLEYDFSAVPKINTYNNTAYMQQYRNDKVVEEQVPGLPPVYKTGTRETYLKAKRKYQHGGGNRLTLINYLNGGARKNGSQRKPYAKSVKQYKILHDEATFAYA